MLNIDLLKKNYTGRNINIALIDAGICDNMQMKSFNITHFIIANKEVIKGRRIKSNLSHGAICADKLLQYAPHVNMMDFDVTDEDGVISEENIILAIDYAISLNVDIISISLGLDCYTQALYDVCNKGKLSGIAIVASDSHHNHVVYPADFDCAVKICCSSPHSDTMLIKKIGPGIFDVLCDTVKIETDGTESCGSSISTAFFSGILALYMESRPLVDRDMIINQLTENIDNANSEADEKEAIKSCMPDLYTVLPTYSNHYIKHFGTQDESLIEYSSFVDMLNKTSQSEIRNINISETLVINPNHYFLSDTLQDSGNDIKLLGLFGDDKSSKMHDDCYVTTMHRDIEKRSHKIHSISTPAIIIAGFGPACSKFDVQLEIMAQLETNDVVWKATTYNPLGVIFNMDVISYPSSISFPGIVFDINNRLRTIEMQTDPDCFVLNIGGGIQHLNDSAAHDFGSLFDAHMKAILADYIILCTNTKISVSMVAENVKSLQMRGIPCVSVVISDYTYTFSSLDDSRGLRSTIACENELEAYKASLNREIPECLILSFKDVVDGSLCTHIINSLS
ncbi:MAG: S8/S53 family peptidase [Defluviitaleaceae bacterium]|nr:S8/S53 family peptidase [Defluviitaleaceae bacterium]